MWCTRFQSTVWATFPAMPAVPDTWKKKNNTGKKQEMLISCLGLKSPLISSLSLCLPQNSRSLCLSLLTSPSVPSPFHSPPPLCPSTTLSSSYLHQFQCRRVSCESAAGTLLQKQQSAALTVYQRARDEEGPHFRALKGVLRCRF